MVDTARRLREITDAVQAQEPTPDPPRPRQEARINAQEQAAAKLMLTALGALKDRATIEGARLRGLLLAGSVFALFWWAISHNPGWQTITVASIYAGFVSLFEFARRK